MTSITADDLASDDPCPSLSMNEMNDAANPSKVQQVNSYPLLFFQVMCFLQIYAYM